MPPTTGAFKRSLRPRGDPRQSLSAKPSRYSCAAARTRRHRVLRLRAADGGGSRRTPGCSSTEWGETDDRCGPWANRRPSTRTTSITQRWRSCSRLIPARGSFRGRFYPRWMWFPSGYKDVMRAGSPGCCDSSPALTRGAACAAIRPSTHASSWPPDKGTPSAESNSFMHNSSITCAPSAR